MESLIIRYQATLKCLESLHESLEVIADPKFVLVYEQLRDSVIQRFEYTIDTFWKYLREYLELVHGTSFTVVSPREVLRTALQMGSISQQEFDLFTQMVRDRNLTSHTYNEILAETIKEHVIQYYQAIKTVITRLQLPPAQK